MKALLGRVKTVYLNGLNRLKEQWAKRQVLFDFMKTKSNRIWKYTIYYFKLARLRIKNELFGLWLWSKAKNVILLTLVYYAIAIAIARLALPSLTTEDILKNLPTFFISAGAMIGGMLAILFSLSTILIQNAAEKFSAGFFEALANDKVLDFIFFILALFSLSCFGTGLYISHTTYVKQLIFGGLLVIAITLHLTHVIYRRVKKRINPQSGLVMVRDELLKYLSRMRYALEESVKVGMSHPDNADTKKEIMMSAVFRNLSSNVKALNANLDYLFDLHAKYLASNEKNTALQTLNVIKVIIFKYFNIRKDNSMTHLEGILVPVSDSRDFLTPTLERLVSIAASYIRNHDDEGASRVVGILKELALSATQVKHIDLRLTDNPDFNQCTGYLTQLTDIAVDEKNLETLFQGIRAVGDLAVVAVEQKLDTEVFGLSDQILKISKAALLLPIKNRQLIYEYGLYGQLKILNSLLANDYFNLHVQLSHLTKNIREQIIYGFQAARLSGLDNALFVQTVLSKPFDNMALLVQGLIHELRTATETNKKNRIKNMLHYLLEEGYMMYRLLPEQLKTADHLLTANISKSVFSIAEALLTTSDIPELQHDPSINPAKEAESFMHVIDFITSSAPTYEGNGHFDETTENVAKIGIVAIDTDHFDIAKDAAEIIANEAIDSFTKLADHGFGYTEPRIMIKAMFVAAYAMKKGHNEIAELVKNKIAKYQPLYEAKYFTGIPAGTVLKSPTPDQLKTEFDRSVDEINDVNQLHIHGLLDRVDDMLVGKLTKADAEVFVNYIWPPAPKPYTDDQLQTEVAQ
jgi:hypothetical protein